MNTRLLIVDDDEKLCRLVKEYLEPLGYAWTRRPPPDDPLGLGPGGRGDARPEPGRLPRVPDAAPFLVTVDTSPKYWSGVRIPIRQRGQMVTTPGTLLFASTTLVGNPYYFQPLPWVAVVLVALAVTAACWFPFVRGVTNAVGAITEASRQIAEGRFDVAIPTRRRDELGVLAESVRQMAARLEAFVHGHKRFLADVAHELRSPLARIAIATGLLERAAGEPHLRHVRDLMEDVEVMTQLTDDLLVFARTELAPSPIRLEPTSVRDAAARAVHVEAKDATVDPAVDPDLRVLATPDMLSRIFANLIRNSVQHAQPHALIQVAATRAGDAVTITVADDGPGIPEADLTAVFEPFRRPEPSRDRRTGGVGLGLAIVRSAVEACGGAVGCRNRVPRGLEVHLELRAA